MKDVLREWECPKGCGKQRWEHELHNINDVDVNESTWECPQPPEPRDCCGRLADDTEDEKRACSNGACVAWWCQCGVFTGMSAGPVFCGCEYDRGEVPTTRPLTLDEAADKIATEYGDALRTLGREEDPKDLQS